MCTIKKHLAQWNKIFTEGELEKFEFLVTAVFSRFKG